MSSALRKIPTSEILRNPLNPRMEFEPITMEVLRRSIDKVGILLPDLSSVGSRSELKRLYEKVYPDVKKRSIATLT